MFIVGCILTVRSRIVFWFLSYSMITLQVFIKTASNRKILNIVKRNIYYYIKFC
jgi:hypothetical protein